MGIVAGFVVDSFESFLFYVWHIFKQDVCKFEVYFVTFIVVAVFGVISLYVEFFAGFKDVLYGIESVFSDGNIVDEGESDVF